VKGGLRAGLIDRAVEHVLSLHFTHTQEPQLFMPLMFFSVANPDLIRGFSDPWITGLGSRIPDPIYISKSWVSIFGIKNSLLIKSNPFLYSTVTYLLK
jgi:hypothetical protein